MVGIKLVKVSLKTTDNLARYLNWLKKLEVSQKKVLNSSLLFLYL